MVERLNEEIRRREKVLRIFPLRSEPKGSLDWLVAHAASDLDGEGRLTGSGILQQLLDLIR
jgi:transposase-like protein